MIPSNLTEKLIRFYKIAKKHEISMTRSTERYIEVNEQDINKFNAFAKKITDFSPDTQILDLIRSNEYTDIRNHSIEGDKALYLIDDDYYKKLIGESSQEPREGQISLF